MQRQYFSILTIFVLIFPNEAQSANILFVDGCASPSHHIWNRALALGLVNKGHNVTYISASEDAVPKTENYTAILLEGVYDQMYPSFDVNRFVYGSVFGKMHAFHDWSVIQCEIMLKTKGLRFLWNYPKDFKFDLILIDITLGPCLYHLIQRFEYPPTVGVTAFLLPPYLSFNFGNHLYASHVPWHGLTYSPVMTFPQRVLNFVFTYLDVIQRNYYENELEENMAKEVFGKHLAPWKKIENHIELLLANTDPILDLPQILPANIIAVGGLHTRPGKDLPQDLRDVLDNAKHGVVVFSLGTNVRSADQFNNSTKRALLEAFAEIPQTVIWKYEDHLDELPKNVILKKWLPQNDVLSHPNVKLFIGHGGALSTQEALYHGIPMLSMPFTLDQHPNTRLIVDKKVALGVDFNTITKNSFLEKLKETLTNPIYRDNAKLISKRFRDLAETPLERAIFWSEYAMKHEGARFLNSPARSMPFYASSSVDVVSFLVIVAIISVLVCYKIIMFLLSFKPRSKEKLN